MRPDIADTKHTLEYGHTHDMARQLLPGVLGAIALGLFLLMSIDGAATDSKGALLGGLAIALGIAFLGGIVYRRSLPSVPNLVVSEQGILFRTVSEKIIPWSEIRDVRRDTVRAVRDFFSTKAVRIALSPAFYERYTEGRWHESVTGESGEKESAIFLAYYLDVPHDELYAAVRKRWREFSHHATGVAISDADVPDAVAVHAEDARPLAGSVTSAAPRRPSVIQRGSSFESLQAIGGLVRESSPGQLLGSVVALAAIVALATNLMGFWSTARQDRGRAEAAKWKAWSDNFERERAATDADQRRIKEMWERQFKCMDEYWALHDMGRRGDPACMKDGK